MSNQQRFSYRRTFLLIFVFLVLISISFIVAIVLARKLTRKYVENEFQARKTEVLESNIASYNEFFQNRIPEITYYQGYLDSVGVAGYAESIFKRFPFVERLVFYDVEISGQYASHGVMANNLALSPKSVFQFGPQVNKDSIRLYRRGQNRNFSLLMADEFNKMALKFAGFLEEVDTSKTINNDDLFKIFYSITPGKITYMNIPRREDIKIYKQLMFTSQPDTSTYEQDILTYYINPNALSINNTRPELYQKVEIRPLVYESLDTNPDLLTAETPLPGALADYKIYFSSDRTFLWTEINRRFMPVAATVIVIYIFLLLIAYLIYRNLNINRRMFKLQYDFVNNLTHEFKTPVSVIKIAGNNIKSAKQLSDRERSHYGRILDEEADKLNNLLNTLLSFTQIENKAIKIKAERIDLHEFCRKIVDAYLLKYPDFDLKYNIDHDIKGFQTDPVLLGSVFQNLIDNAYKYSGPENKYLRIEILLQKKLIVFKFADKGIGIAKKELDNIFKKFYRIQSQYNQQGSVGLGLAFCKELVNFLNGEISVESVVGKGSIFTIALPFDNKKNVMP
ncbi:two-component system, OmpR family, phosphate regulon sensor histidine kinase PhoR [bacterium A37T11]|nr:two-component system, OmpR family, phosphate regulon sensor histidine kinase PhoR [bacterium A37T11]